MTEVVVSEELPERWSDMRLDAKLIEAIKDLRWPTPLPVQQACIPHALRGNDVSLQSRTGSGKTGAFAIPMLQRLLGQRERAAKTKQAAPKPFGLILVPSLELCEQTVEAAEALAKYVKPGVVIDNLCSSGSLSDARLRSADIVVCTPAALAKAVKAAKVTDQGFRDVSMVIMDEVDMILSIAERSFQLVQSILPLHSAQSILCSATLTEGVAGIKGQLQHRPVHIVLTGNEDDAAAAAVAKRPAATRTPTGTAAAETPEVVVESHIVLRDPSAKTLKQYYLVATDECHKHTLLFSLYRLGRIEGKTLIFADDEDETYRLEHFLQQLGIACVVYDVSLPVSARFDILRRFQKGQLGTLICTDSTLESAERLQMSIDDSEGAGVDGDDGESRDAVEPARKKHRRDSRADGGGANSGLHRGVDFHKVRNVIIFDGMDTPSPINISKYMHRVGRTGRSGQPGTSILILSVPQSQKCVGALRQHLKASGDHFRPFKQLDRAEAAKLQYRTDTVLSNVTRNATKKLRVSTVAAELARSSYLSTHLSQRDTEALEKIVKKSSKKVRCDRSVLDLPSYMGLGKKVDDVDAYADRVNLRGPRKEQVFRAVTRKKSVDPLKAVVSKVRFEKRNGSAKPPMR